ncbi:MDR family MFS transporter [Dactylosporangium sp. CA-092794]|uniref:MDR family MFS transporter n=1 Tax=Dactylosporangium sp. CA-092794 TaxID=3239929 RepID=UPI003D8F0A8A
MSSPQVVQTRTATGPGVDPAVWRTAFTIIAGAMVVVFDATIVSVALNDLAKDLHAPISTIQWVSTGYLLAMFVTIPVAGWAQSALGGKRLWIVALGVFLLGSVLCACAWDAPSLIAFRIVQGIGGGVIMPLMMTLIMQAAGGRNVGTVMSVVTLPSSLGPILGPVLGGIILNFGDWRWLFLVNIPFCTVGALLALRNLPNDRPSARTRLDWVGLLLLSPGVAAIIFGLSRVNAAGGFGSAQVLVPVLGGLALVAGFVRWALPRASTALVNVRLFRHRPLASSSALGFLTGAALYGALLLLPLYWQQVRGESALNAGLLLIPQGVGTLVSRRPAGKLIDEIGPRWVALVGFAIVTVGTLPFGFVTDHTGNVLLLAALFVRGIGMGATTISLSGTAYIGLPRPDMPSGSIIARVGQQIGGSAGTAVLAVILLAAAAGDAGPAHAFREAFWWSIGFAAVAVPLCLLLPGRPAPERRAAGSVLDEADEDHAGDRSGQLGRVDRAVGVVPLD